VFIIKPFVEDGECRNFEYSYANRAFSLMVGVSRKELIGHNYLEIFKKEGERSWLDVFRETAVNKKHTYVDNVSEIINKKLYIEVFHIEPDLCGCIVHDFGAVSDNIRSREYAELHRRADCDFLTGFYNRFYLKELYNDIEQRENVGISYVDINNLKKTNDSEGHAAGDELIKKVCELLKNSYNGSMIFRMGGDEFLIITTGMGRDEYIGLAEKCRTDFENDNLAAIGYGFYERMDNLKNCIDECDAMMYEHKKNMKLTVS
jgi:diguanylate cyclase (GGDEF)-like protein